MQAALAQVEQYCDPSTNAYVDIAKFLWAAYQRSHDPVAACEAMDRFRLSEYYADPGQPNAASFLNDPTISIPHCPFR